MNGQPGPKGRIRRSPAEKWCANVAQMKERNRDAMKADNAKDAKAALQKAGEEDLLGPRFRNGRN